MDLELIKNIIITFTVLLLPFQEEILILNVWLMPSKCIIHSVSQLKEKKWPFAQKQFGTQPDDYHKKA